MAEAGKKRRASPAARRFVRQRDAELDAMREAIREGDRSVATVHRDLVDDHILNVVVDKILIEFERMEADPSMHRAAIVETPQPEVTVSRGRRRGSDVVARIGTR